MSLAAWITMLSAWGIITVYTVYFFIKVLKSPQRTEREN